MNFSHVTTFTVGFLKTPDLVCKMKFFATRIALENHESFSVPTNPWTFSKLDLPGYLPSDCIQWPDLQTFLWSSLALLLTLKFKIYHIHVQGVQSSVSYIRKWNGQCAFHSRCIFWKTCIVLNVMLVVSVIICAPPILQTKDSTLPPCCTLPAVELTKPQIVGFYSRQGK